jgi:hypothetical protein
MAKRRPLVDNAGAVRQVKRAKREERDAYEMELADIRAVVATEAGQRDSYRQCEAAFRSVFHPDPYVMAYQAGEQNAALKRLAKIEEADPRAFDQMLDRARRQRDDDRQRTDASHTPRATEASDDEDDE